MKQTNQSLQEKRKWIMEDFKTSEDIVDRTVWFIATLSPHNLWKGEEALRSLINSEIQRAVLEERKIALGNAEVIEHDTECDDGIKFEAREPLIMEIDKPKIVAFNGGGYD